MMAYFDSGVLVKLYLHETNSADATALVQSCPTPSPLTSWQELEVRTAVRLKVFRGEITAADLHTALGNLDSDIALGRWHQPHIKLQAVLHKAGVLSEQHAAAIGCRTLDIIHVAAAVVIEVTDFFTFDHRQSELARQAGLTVKP